MKAPSTVCTPITSVIDRHHTRDQQDRGDHRELAHKFVIGPADQLKPSRRPMVKLSTRKIAVPSRLCAS